jgi:ABC-type glutathione transport system ATPase component
VSHRLALARETDRVVVLDAGRVVEQGSPSELLEGDGDFARMWALQHPGERRCNRSGGAPDELPVERRETETLLIERR